MGIKYETVDVKEKYHMLLRLILWYHGQLIWPKGWEMFAMYYLNYVIQNIIASEFYHEAFFLYPVTHYLC